MGTKESDSPLSITPRSSSSKEGQRNGDKGIRFSCLRSPAVLSPRNIVPSPVNRPIWTATIPRRHFRPAGVRAWVAGDPTAYFTGDLSRAGGFGDFGKERGKHEIRSMSLSPKRLPGESLDALLVTDASASYSAVEARGRQSFLTHRLAHRLRTAREIAQTLAAMETTETPAERFFAEQQRLLRRASALQIPKLNADRSGLHDFLDRICSNLLEFRQGRDLA